MASSCKILILLQLFSIVLFFSQTHLLVTAAKDSGQANTNFVKTKCKITTYPSLCLKTLIPYASSVKANSTKLCKEALNVATKGARDASTIVLNLKKQKGITRSEAAAIKDCIEDVKDAVYELKRAVDAIGHLGDKDKAFQLANAKTYASAAITDADSCTDGLTDQAAKESSRPAAYTNFIKTKCNITTNPSLCVKTLMPYASTVKTNPRILCKEALKVAIKGARSASLIFWNLKKQDGISQYEAGAIRDCVEAVKTAVHELKQTVNTIGHLSGAEDKESQLHNAISYASSALTNAETCIDGFSESEEKVNPDVKKVIDKSITVIKTLASNALSLISDL
uniref:Pectinesterase inhibitor domain-containing protein n=1 Tax=Solanum tuberosum TaxID=4113 RepID=M1AQK7_SOLTU